MRYSVHRSRSDAHLLARTGFGGWRFPVIDGLVCLACRRFAGIPGLPSSFSVSDLALASAGHCILARARRFRCFLCVYFLASFVATSVCLILADTLDRGKFVCTFGCFMYFCVTFSVTPVLLNYFNICFLVPSSHTTFTSQFWFLLTSCLIPSSAGFAPHLLPLSFPPPPAWLLSPAVPTSTSPPFPSCHGSMLYFL